MSDPVKKQRPAGELSPTELVQHKLFDAVRTHSCTNCGKVFAIENLKCPECSTIAKGNEQGPFSNYSYEDTKANIENRVDSAAPAFPVRQSILHAKSRTSARKKAHAIDPIYNFYERAGKAFPGQPQGRSISYVEANLLPVLFGIRAILVSLIVYVTLWALFTGALFGVFAAFAKAWDWFCHLLSYFFVH